MKKGRTVLKPVERQLLALVRASLWQQPVETAELLDGSVDWAAIGRLAMEQTVGPLVFEAALSLPPELRPPKEWARRAFAFLGNSRQTHVLVDRSAAEATAKLADAGIDTVILKGQAYARAYPRPEMRQCGDIDLYVGEDNYRRAFETVRSFGWESRDKFSLKSKHYECQLNGVEIELHKKASILTPKSVDRKFQEWAGAQLALSDRTKTIGGREIRVPTPIFDIVFVFLHLYLHFVNSGIGLRHLCDWTMLLHSRSKEIDLGELEKNLRDFRLLKAWKTFAPILVRYLGLPEGECPFYAEENVPRAEKALLSVFKEGNFGMAAYSDKNAPKGYFAWKIFSFRRQSIHKIKKLWVDPWPIAQIYGRYVATGVSAVIKDKFKREKQ